MIYKSELDRQAEELINEIKRINFEYGGKISQNKIDKMSANLIVDFAIDLCEKQKGIEDNIWDTGIEL